MIRLLIAPVSLFTASSAMAQPEGVPPGPPTVEVVGTVDANVVNTVDTNAVTEYRVVGASEATITGDANGIRGLHDICQAEFGIEARTCTTPEVVATTDLTALEFGNGISAWVQPVIASHGLVHNPDANQISERWVGFAADVTDVSLAATSTTPANATFRTTLSCSRWSNDGVILFGTAFTSGDGMIEESRLRLVTCNNPHRVLCCIPRNNNGD